jgi:hypothetical protein
MRSVLDGLLEENGATGPESISIFAEPGVGYSEKLKKVKKNSPVKIQIFIRKELTSEKTISLKKVLVYFGEDAHIKEFKDTRFDRIYVTEDKLIDTNEEVPEQFNETIVMIFGAMGRAIAASVEQLKTRMDEIRAALTGA